jgi:pimeloyl-ACP methyl ester carboxylesterase
MPEYAERFVTSADGLRLFARDYPAEDSPRRAPVICIHGLTRNSADFENVAPYLAALGRRIVVVDVRGRGRSDRDPQPGRYQVPTYVQDALAVLDAFEIPRAVYIGTSMGGLISMMTAAMAPQRMVACVLNDIGPVVDPAGLKRIASYVGKSGPFAAWDDLIAAVRTTQAIAYPDARPAFWAAVARRVGRENPDGSIAFDYDPAIARAFEPPKEGTPAPAPDLMPLFKALSERPVLVVRGALSDILSAEGVAAMREVNPRLQSVEVPRVGHAPMLDEPEARAALTSFLATMD